MKKALIQLAKIIVPVGLGVYLTVHIYNGLDEDQRSALFEALRKADYFWVGLSFLLGLLSHFIRGYRWNFQLEAMGYRVSTLNNFLAVMIGYIVNLILPRVGEVSRAAAITKYEKVPFEKSFGSILSERALDFIVLLSITVLTLLLQYSILQPFADDLLEAVSGKAGSAILWTVLGAAAVGAVIGIRLLDRWKDRPGFSMLWKLKEGLLEGLRSVFKMKKRGAYLAATVAIWFLYIAMFWVCFYALPETSALGASAVFAGFVVGSFAIVIVPGGIGAFPVGIMQALLLYGIAGETGFALGWILWISQTSMIVIFGGISMIIMPVLKRNKPQHVSV